MNCSRCHGLMYRMELRDNRGFERLKVSMCVLCGEIMDPVIAFNRMRNVAEQVPLPKHVPRHSKYWRKLKTPLRYRKAETELVS
jgi:hypothetical protein